MRRRSLVVALVALAAACSDRVDLGEPTSSGVVGLPVPSAAEDQGEAGGTTTFLLGEGTTFDAIDDWYDEQLPDGEFRSPWTACPRIEPYEQRVALAWVNEENNDLVQLSYFHTNGDEDTGDEPGWVIAIHLDRDGGPC